MNTMPDAQPVKLRIEKLVAGGDGLAFHEGRAVFVPFALPGETVLASIAREKRDFASAELVELLVPSVDRIKPACAIFGKCGGCNLQHLAYGAQVEAKALLVTEAFRRTGRIDPGQVAVVPSLSFAYRNRLQFHFTREGRIGFMPRSSSQAIEASTCPVALRPIQAWIEERAGSDRGFEELKAHIMGKDRFLAFGYGEEVWVEGVHNQVEVRVAGEAIRFHLKGFFQSNLYLLEHFVPDALAGLAGERAADLYCGVGLFARFLSRAFARISCVEQDPFALELARINAPGEGNDYQAVAVEDWIRTAPAAESFDCVLVDPPRTGLSRPVRDWLIRSRARVLVYVSCDPVTLARDSGELVRAGYRLESLKAYDFFPQTSHVECHARFARA